MASSPSHSSSTRRIGGKGRRKTGMKVVEDPTKRLVCFSKRKAGLFRKASELSLRCDSEIAVVVFSEKGKVFSSGHHDTDSVIDRYLWGQSDSSCLSESEAERREFEKNDGAAAAADVSCSGSWWDRSIGEMCLEEAIEFKEGLELLRINLLAAAALEKERETEKAVASSSSSPVTLPAPTEEEGLYEAMMSSADDHVGVPENGTTWGWDWDLDSWNFSDATDDDAFDLSRFF